MELFINHQKKSFAEKLSSLEALILSEVPKAPKGIAVAVNDQIIPRKYWATTPLHQKDKILIITATQGG